MKNLIVKMMLKKVFALFSQTKLIWLALLMVGTTAHAGVTVRYQHTDTLGSVIMETNASGQMIGSRHQYQPFGQGLNGQKTGLGYTGHLEDTDLGLTYMQQRYYDPVVGRFYSNDPVDMLGHMQKGNPTMGFNRYAYANNNPYKYVDPDGQFGQIAIGAIIGAVVGAGVEAYKQVESGNGLDVKALAVEGLKGAVVGGSAAAGGAFMGALFTSVESTAIGTAGAIALGSSAGAAIGSGVNMYAEMAVNAAQGEGFAVSNIRETNAEIGGNVVGAGLGQAAGSVVKAVVGSNAFSAVTRESVSTGTTEMIKNEAKEK